MVRIGDLSDELLVKILTFLPTKAAISTSILSKKWEFLWMWLPKLEYSDYRIKAEPHVSLPRSLYTCSSLTTLKLQGKSILVDVPPTVCLPSLKTLELQCVTYVNEDSLHLLISKCPVLEDLVIKEGGNVRAIVVKAPSLQRLVLVIGERCSSDGFVIVTPSLKYFKVEDKRDNPSCLIEPMPKLEEADIDVLLDIEKILKSVKSAKRLSLRPMFYSAEESMYGAGIVFSQLEHLKICIFSKNWSKMLLWLLRNSPKLRVLNLYVDRDPYFDPHETVKLKKKRTNKRSSVPQCLLSSLGTFEFVGFMGRQEEREFVSFVLEHASCLKSTSIIDRSTQLGYTYRDRTFNPGRIA
ncbi:unnamed protein product [Microthlaspi erraticum]|uniref:Uncharacterized protein n=1 Tax=Microthlaspi erraticum TaxID=1685480 RepID=A0A6D2K556_9BRAS|nr:unnamed protein product [Microthlaspi erraticum]